MQGYDALTEKEKQTLRLLLVGHDAKSMARHFDLSVHTINERLRDARRKLSVSSSKEAARLLREVEGSAPDLIGDTTIGDAASGHGDHDDPYSPPSSRSPRWMVWAIGGIVMMSLTAVLIALSAPVQTPVAPSDASTASPIAESEAAKAARDWLMLVDEAKWQESWAATGQSFRSVNTVALWQSVSEKAHAPLGRMVTRTLVSDVDTPAPPRGSHTVQFRTDFSNKRSVIETLSLIREDGIWKVAGIYIE